MKRSFLISALLIMTGTIYSQSQPVMGDFKKFDWLEGTWNRTDVKPGHSEHERWEKLSDTEWQGFGVTMKGKDTAFVEKLKLVIKDDNIYYAADVAENKGIVYFKLTEIAQDSFVCENPEHDFPKKIAYQKDGSKIKATISGNGKSIDYWFEKK
jgi:hypothetical protein